MPERKSEPREPWPDTIPHRDLRRMGGVFETRNALVRLAERIEALPLAADESPEERDAIAEALRRMAAK
jgi:hypothetical protein